MKREVLKNIKKGQDGKISLPIGNDPHAKGSRDTVEFRANIREKKYSLC
ncbi:MAG: hypothetical protein FWH04_02770 [Oscillospiraceae bacterium]|nr:hypothetical protein [Oscillospiraceae bacterium]